MKAWKWRLELAIMNGWRETKIKDPVMFLYVHLRMMHPELDPNKLQDLLASLWSDERPINRSTACRKASSRHESGDAALQRGPDNDAGAGGEAEDAVPGQDDLGPRDGDRPEREEWTESVP